MSEWNDSAKSRRLLPSINALAAFDAAARTGSFTRAAADLSLSQSAVSKQIAALEQQLGLPLFEEARTRGLVLTNAGAFYQQRVRQVLAQLSSATAATMAFNGAARTLRLGVPASFGSRWLIPRIAGFFAAQPEVTIEFATRVAPRLQSSYDSLDASIEFAPEPDTDHCWRHLMKWDVSPVATPQLTKALGLKTAADLCNATVLLHTSDVDLWSTWSRKVLGGGPTVKTVIFEHYAMVFQAAAADLGVAIAPTALVEKEIAKGDLVFPLDLRLHSQNHCYLVYPRNRKGLKPLQIFERWLFEQRGRSLY